ncbi:MAG: ABC transporter ATP-binding protein [Sulfobacillus sp.]|nr:ABC transporter ATP-binding protein [Sulfobacillus sp.]
MAHVSIRHLSRRFGSYPALDQINLDVDSGEFVSLLGPSGSGKTTLLRIIAGFERPDIGDVYVDGRPVTRVPPQKRQMGMVFQSYALFPNLTVRDNIGFGLKVRRWPADQIQRRVDELVELVGLSGKGHRLPRQLSGGEQQRVALARALAPNPAVLLLDEPLSALDAQIRMTLRREIRRIQEALRITTVYVTHDQEEALALSDRVVVMHQGRIEQAGPPMAIYDHPATDFVRRFIGTSNRLKATVVAGDIGLCRIDGQVVHLTEAIGRMEGSTVDLWLRPEHVRLEAVGMSRDNALLGRIDDVVFLGARRSIRIRVGLQSLIVDQVRLPEEPAWSPGDPVSVVIPRHAPVLEDETAVTSRKEVVQ